MQEQDQTVKEDKFNNNQSEYVFQLIQRTVAVADSFINKANIPYPVFLSIYKAYIDTQVEFYMSKITSDQGRRGFMELVQLAREAIELKKERREENE